MRPARQSRVASAAAGAARSAAHDARLSFDGPAEPATLRELMKRRDYVLFWIGRVGATLGVQIQSVALGWQMYAVARETMDVKQSAFYVGMIGLAAFIPVLLLSPIAGETADRHDRRKVLLLCYTGEIATAVTLAAGLDLRLRQHPAAAGALGPVRGQPRLHGPVRHRAWLRCWCRAACCPGPSR
jgi:MFS family permease